MRQGGSGHKLKADKKADKMKEKNRSSEHNKKSKSILAAFRLAQRLMRGNRGKLYSLMAALTLFNIEAALMMPVILKCGFRAVAENSIRALVGTAIGGVCVFAFNFAAMYFINVYGDAWVTTFAFHAAENCFKELSVYPVASIQAEYNDDDLFNRIAAGTGDIMGLYFSLVNLLGNGVAVAVLMVMLCRFSSMLGGIIILLVAAEMVFVRLQFRYNADYAKRLQKDKAEGIRRVRSLLEQLPFHQHNQTWEWMRGLYGEAREQWLLTQGKKTMTSVFLDSCLTGIHGIFKTGLVYGFMVRQEVFSSYADDVVSSFSTFNSLVTKAKGFSESISRLPNSLVPIGKLDDVLAGHPQHAMGQGGNCLVLEGISVAVGDKMIVKDASCRIPLGSKVAVIGENGSGKSTLLKAMSGLYRCQDGKVHGLGKKAAYIPSDELLFQGHSVLENISYGRDGIGTGEAERQLKELRIHGAGELCGKIPAQLSGGEAKRVNIARGLLGDAEVILADEPTSCLDKETSRHVMGKLLGMEGRTVIYVTHDPEYAKLADEVIFMQDGEIRQVIKGNECDENECFRSWSKEGTIV